MRHIPTQLYNVRYIHGVAGSLMFADLSKQIHIALLNIYMLDHQQTQTLNPNHRWPIASKFGDPAWEAIWTRVHLLTQTQNIFL